MTPRSETASRTFEKGRRLRRRAEFQRVFDGGQRIRGRFLTVIVAPSETSGGARLGLVASRKLGDAVRRNLAKRLIREIFRLNPPQPGDTRGVDIVVIPRVELFDAAYTTLVEDYRSALSRGLSRLRKL